MKCEECGSTRFFAHCYPECPAIEHLATCRDCKTLNVLKVNLTKYGDLE